MAKKLSGKKSSVTNDEMFEVLVFLKDKVGDIEERMTTKEDLVHFATKEDIQELRERVISLEKGQGEILDTLRPLSKAHDKDTLAILDHERRIVVLEKHALAK